MFERFARIVTKIREILEMKTLEEIKSALPDFSGRNRKIEVVNIRHVFCYLARKEGYCYTEIGRFIKRTHATVLHSCKKVQELISIKDERIMELMKNNLQ